MRISLGGVADREITCCLCRLCLSCSRSLALPWLESSRPRLSHRATEPAGLATPRLIHPLATSLRFSLSLSSSLHLSLSLRRPLIGGGVHVTPVAAAAAHRSHDGSDQSTTVSSAPSLVDVDRYHHLRSAPTLRRHLYRLTSIPERSYLERTGASEAAAATVSCASARQEWGCIGGLTRRHATQGTKAGAARRGSPSRAGGARHVGVPLWWFSRTSECGAAASGGS